jgi:hypothetical protein
MHLDTYIIRLIGCNFLKYVTLFSCDTFGFYVSWVYLQYGIQVLTRQLQSADPSNPLGSFVSIILALLMLVTSFLFQSLSQKPYFHRHIRRFLADYGMPMSLVAVSAMAYWGRFNHANPSTLPIGAAFKPAGGRDWLVKFWQLEGKWVGIALPFGIVLWILFFFDHNVSVSFTIVFYSRWQAADRSQSLMAQSSDFPLRKPPGFHYDFFLLGVSTFLAGLLGVPAPNGLIPQAPIHTTSLLVMGHHARSERDKESAAPQSQTLSSTAEMHAFQDMKYPSDQVTIDKQEFPIAVVEQRVSNLSQGALCLVLLTGPFLHVLGLIPRGMISSMSKILSLADSCMLRCLGRPLVSHFTFRGIESPRLTQRSWFMGTDALQGNGITHKILYFLRDKTLTPTSEPLRKVRKSRILLFVGVQLAAFGATFAITQTIGERGPHICPSSLSFIFGQLRLGSL